MPSGGKENRRDKRYVIAGCSLRYEVKKLLGLFSSTSEKYLVLDISSSGLQFISKEKFKLHTPMTLNITAPSLKHETITLSGQVAWVRHASGLDVYGIGIEFSGIDETNRSRLQSLLDYAGTDQKKIASNVHLKTTNP